MNKQDCEVCQKLMKEKHKFDFLWKICCILFLAVAIIFAILYFSNTGTNNETKVENAGNNNHIEGDGNINIAGIQSIIDGNVENTHTDYTSIICISIICISIIFVSGGVIISHAYKNKKDDNNR